MPGLYLERKTWRRGFTIIETLVYLSILALMLVAVVAVLLNMSRVYNTLTSNRTLNASAVASMERIVREIRQANSIDVANSIFNVNPGKLVLNTTDENGAVTTVEFSVSNGLLAIKQGGNTLGPLNLSSTTVDSLVFRQISTAVSDAVKVELVLTSSYLASSKTERFYSTAILRGSYAQ